MTGAIDRNRLGAMGLSLKLFGGFAVRDESGADLSLRTRKMRALLAYLAVNADKPQPRERLMVLLWGDRDERQARPSLNNALMAIRRLVGGGEWALLDSDTSHVTLHGAAVECDVNRFRTLLTTDAATAAELYDGPFLDGLSIPEPAFEEWLTATRLELQAGVCDALQHVANEAARSGEIRRAIEAARRLVTLDPLREDGHRLLMRLLHESGDRVAALRQHQTCVDILAVELGVEPDVTTRTLYEEIRRNANIAATSPQTPAASSELPTLPDKPSVAVLPFKNLSADPEQEYFSDGITEDIITDLSKVSGLFVIARNSAFVYKGQATEISEIARELGVQYLLEGSVRRSGGRIRINVQLVDAVVGNHLWAERYNEDLQDIFAVQDKITESIVAALAVTLTRVEQARAMRKEAPNLKAYDYVLRGNAYHHRLTKEDNIKARENYEEAIKTDPRYAPAYAGLAWVLVHDANQGWGYDPQTLLNRAFETAKRAVILDDSLAKAHLVLGDVFMWMKNNDQAVEAGRKAIALDPSYADGHFALSAYLRYAGQAEEALEEIQKALRFNPMHGHRLYYFGLGRTHYALKQYEAAAQAGQWALSYDSEVKGSHVFLAAAYAQMGRSKYARRHARETLRIDPTFSARQYVNFLPFKNKVDADHYLEGLRKAGLPE